MTEYLKNNIRYSVEDLLYLVNRLRDPQTGCPWDVQQNYRTIIPHTLEEVYEVVDAIDNQDFVNLKEELGDLLLQIILYTQFAKEDDQFSFAEVVSDLVAKLIRRHPHVFPEGTLESRIQPTNNLTLDNVRQSWDEIKKSEKRMNHSSSNSRGVSEPLQTERLLDGLPRALPAIQRALKLQVCAAKIGFDWNSVPKVVEKLDEELAELKALLLPDDATESVGQLNAQKAREAITGEIGDIMFVCVNIARHMKIDPEEALRKTNRKFESRFNYLEDSLKKQGVSLQEASLAQMEALWEEAKCRLDDE